MYKRWRVGARWRLLLMGYQESYVRMKKREDFDKLVEAFRAVGKQFYEEYCTEPVRIITLKKPIEGTLDMMCMPEETYRFEPGEKFVYVVGERHLQRSPYLLMNNDKADDVEIYFTECFPSDDIFENNDTADMAIHEEFVW